MKKSKYYFAALAFLICNFQLVTFNSQAQYSNFHLIDFNGTGNGSSPYGDLVSDGTYLYGTTDKGGANGYGTIFRVKPDGTGDTVLLNFNRTNGSYPIGSLTYINGFLYGMTQDGGTDTAAGVIFRIKTDGTGDTVLLNFNVTNGSNPFGSLVYDGSTYLYGTTYQGGSGNAGTVFKIKTDGTGDSVLFNFNGSNGSYPYSTLYYDGTYLYGTTNSGGTNSNGTIFKVMPDGTNYSALVNFGGNSMCCPEGSLTSDGTYLYGMTVQNIFKIKTDGTGYDTLLNFNGVNGADAFGTLYYNSVDSYLYGMTLQGGVNGLGNIFKIKTDGTGYVDLLDFNGANGSTPRGSLIYDGTFFYGTTNQGGANSDGTVFKFYPGCSSVSLTSPSGTDAQTVYMNTAITNITYQVTGGVNSVTGLPGGIIGSLNGNVFTISGTPDTAGTFSYTVKTSGSANCSPDSSVGSGSITVNPAPIITQTDTVLTSSIATGNQWYLNGTALPNATAQTDTVRLNGTYTAKVTNGGATSAASNAIVIVLPATPTVTLTGGSTLTSSSATGNQWYVNGNIIPGATGQTYTAAVNGNYLVRVTSTGITVTSNSILISTIPIPPTYTPPYIITTIAGNGTESFSGDGGPADSATLNWPYGVAVDDSGNVYFADEQNQRIRKVTPAGIITTFAGNGYNSGNGGGGFSGDGGPADSAELSNPYAVAVDDSGNVYIADYSNSRIRKVNKSGTISTIAGNGNFAYSGDGGPADSAALNGPSGVAVDNSGNVYIADQQNAVIRKVTPNGIITTFAGNGSQGYSGDGGTATSANLSYPTGVAVDGAGNVYIADQGNNLIRKITGGIITTFAGNGSQGYSGDGNLADSASLNQPFGVAVDDSGNVYIADEYNNAIRRVATTGVISTIAGNGNYGFTGDGIAADSSELYYPQGVAVDASGHIFIGDTYNERIRKLTRGIPTPAITSAGAVLTSSAATGNQWYLNGTAITGAKGQTDTATSNGTYTVKVKSGGFTSGASNAIVITFPATPTITATGTLLTSSSATGNQWFFNGNVLKGDTSKTYTATSNGTYIDRVTLNGITSLASNTINITTVPVPPSFIISSIAGNGNAAFSGDGGPADSAEINRPAGIAVDDSGNVYFADKSNNRVRKVNTKGSISTIAGNGTQGYSGDGSSADSAELYFPQGVAVDDSGNVYIADNGNNVIRKVTKSGTISTFAGNGTSGYSGDGGAANSAELSGPEGLAVDDSGNVYIADNGNNVIRKVNKNGSISTIAGNGTHGFSGDGSAADSAELSSPSGVAVDDSGNVYIADGGSNERIRKVNTSGIISTIAGNGKGLDGPGGYSGDKGPAISAELNFPSSVAVDKSGNVYIDDQNNNRIRVVTPQGFIFTVAGTGTLGFSGDGGTATSAQLEYPDGIAIDGSGNVYISDLDNARIRKLTALPQVKITATKDTICNGNSTILTASGASAYSWAPIVSTGTSITVSPTITTTYTVIGTENGYADTANFTVTVVSIPALSSSLNAGTICSGTAISYLATSGTAGATFAWSRATIAGITQGGDSGTGNVNEVLTNSTNFPVNVSYSYVVSVNGCSSAGNNVVVAVNHSSTSTIGKTTCSSYTSPSGKYTWTTSGTHTDTITNYIGCDSIITINLTVKDSVFGLTILTQNASSTGPHCYGYLEAVAKGAAPYSYMWSDSASVNSPYRFNECAGTYSVTVTDSGGCTASAQASIGTSATTITVSPNPLKLVVHSLDATSINLCNGAANVQVTGGTTPYTISFAGNNATTSNYTINNLCPGFYTANATDANSKTASFTFVIGSPLTTYNSIPHSFVSDSTFKDTLIAPAINNCFIFNATVDSLAIQSFSLFGTDSINVIWGVYQKGTPTIIPIHESYQYNKPGLCRVEVSIFCTSRTSSCIRGIGDVEIIPRAEGIETIGLSPIFVYPNPSTGVFNVKSQTEISTVEVMDVMGQTILTQQVSALNASIDLSKQAKGIYFYKVSSNGSTLGTGKMVIE